MKGGASGKEKDSVEKRGSGEKELALRAALARIEKQYGRGAIMRLGDDSMRARVEAIPTGSISLDMALGVGGLPKGRVVEIFGAEGSGKTTLALHVLAEAQLRGGRVAFIDAEHALDPAYASRIGVNLDSLLLSQPSSGEEALEIADTLVRSGGIDVVVIDSVAALVPKAEIEGMMGDLPVGLQARLMSQALRKLTANISRTNSLCIFINQLREKIGVIFGSPMTTPGGRALKFYSSVRLDVRPSASIKVGDQITGRRIRVKVAKNKVAPPFKTAEFEIVFGDGISYEGGLLDLGLARKIIAQSGSWISWGGERLGQGRENARQWLRDHPERAAELERLIKTPADEAHPETKSAAGNTAPARAGADPARAGADKKSASSGKEAAA